MAETIVHTGITELFSCCKGGKDFVSHCECCCGKMSTNLVNSDSSFYNSSDENDINSSNDVSIELTNADKKLDCILTTISSINMSVVELTNRVNDLEKKLIVNELTTIRNRSVPIGFDYVSSLTPDSTVTDVDTVPVKTTTKAQTPEIKSKSPEPIKAVKRRTPVPKQSSTPVVTPVPKQSSTPVVTPVPKQSSTPVVTPVSETESTKPKKSSKPKKTVIDFDSVS